MEIILKIYGFWPQRKRPTANEMYRSNRNIEILRNFQ